MTGIAGALLTWLVVADTWLRLTIHAEPSAVVIVALVAAVGMLVVAAAVAVRVALRSADRPAAASRVRDRRRSAVLSAGVVVLVRPVGGRGARAPGRGGVPAQVAVA
ncbi:hypothetical protein [Humibacter ginsenosidimutans]|uniref:Uncharacterized protein n=1 Tax=Humibacter ginsenosidimutans TaxID=2599293 RepID=A0A5B8M7S5_9MICO|nr:hypothetical protein [Humibacter ginsenosidimutans]QDZ16537.1 hypothetical protein FPZ11_18895 [Humibacter ginsenosidimutans]